MSGILGPNGGGFYIPDRREYAARLLHDCTKIMGEHAERSGGVARVIYADGGMMTFSPAMSLDNFKKISPIAGTVDVRYVTPDHVPQLRREVIE